MKCIVNCIVDNNKLLNIDIFSQFLDNYHDDFDHIVFVISAQYDCIKIKEKLSIINNVSLLILNEYFNLTQLNQLSTLTLHQNESEWVGYTHILDNSNTSNLHSCVKRCTVQKEVDVIYSFSEKTDDYIPVLFKTKHNFNFDELLVGGLPYPPHFAYRNVNKALPTQCNTKKTVLFTFNSCSQGGISTRSNDEMKVFHQMGYEVIALYFSKFFNLKATEDFVHIFSCSLNINNLAHIVDFVAYLRNLTDCFNINLINCHDVDKSLLASSIVSQLTHTPLIHTLHGATFYEPKQHWERYLYLHILPQGISHHFGMSYMITRYLQAFIPNSLCLPNFVDCDQFRPLASISIDDRWLILGRVAQVKMGGIASFIAYAYAVGIPGVVVVGSNSNGSESGYIAKLIENQPYPKDYVTVIGFSNDTANLINQFAGVAGVDRVALEGIAAEKPTCVIGVDGRIKGLVTLDNFDVFSECNFNGGNAPQVSIDEFRSQLVNLNPLSLSVLRDRLKEKYSLATWLEYYQKIESDFVFKDNPIIVALYYHLLHFQYILRKENNGYNNKNFMKALEDLVYSNVHFSESRKAIFDKTKYDYIKKINYSKSSPTINSLSNININTNTLPEGVILLKENNLCIDINNLEYIVDITEKYTLGVADYLLEISYEAITDSLENFPVLISFDISCIDNKRNILSDDITGMALSQKSKIGFYKNLENNKMGIQFKKSFTVRLSKDSFVKKIKLLKGQLKNNEYYEIMNIKIVGLNIASE